MAIPPRVIVCERTDCWAVALRWALADCGTQVYETRSRSAAWEALRESPASLLALEVRPSSLADSLLVLRDVSRHFPQAAVVVLGDRDLGEAEWVLREAGAVHYVASPRNLAPLARLVWRFLAAASPPTDFRQAVFARLPWA